MVGVCFFYIKQREFDIILEETQLIRLLKLQV